MLIFMHASGQINLNLNYNKLKKRMFNFGKTGYWKNDIVDCHYVYCESDKQIQDKNKQSFKNIKVSKIITTH